MNGTGNTASITSASVQVASGAGVVLTGSKDTIAAAANASIGINGNANTVTATGTGVALDLSGTGNTVTLNSGTITLANGASASVIGNSDRIQGVGSSSIAASGTGDTLIAGSGTTVMTDTGTLGFYDYNQGAGSATIVNGEPWSWTASNELDFGAGLTKENLWFQKSGNNLVIDVMGTTNTVTEQNWLTPRRPTAGDHRRRVKARQPGQSTGPSHGLLLGRPCWLQSGIGSPGSERSNLASGHRHRLA